MKILVIEDDPAVAKAISICVAREGGLCDLIESGEEGVEISRLYTYDAIILDLGLPDISGYQVLRRLRDGECETPILVLTGSDDFNNTVHCLRNGADDFISKPFHREELQARLQAIIRRSKGNADNRIHCGPLTVDLNLRDATVELAGGPAQRVRLSNKEFSIVEMLALNKGRVITKQHIYESLYDYSADEAPTPKIIDVYVCKIRNKLKEQGVPGDLIETVWSQGYRLAVEERFANNTLEPEVLSAA